MTDSQEQLYTNIRAKDHKAVKQLLDAGIFADIRRDESTLTDVTQNVNIEDKDGDTVLMYAANHYDNTDPLCYENFCRIAEMTKDINKRNKYSRYSALEYLAQTGTPEAIQKLIELGANVNQKDIWDSTPLEYSLINRKYDVAQALLDAGAEVRLNTLEVMFWRFKPNAAYVEVALRMLDKIELPPNAYIMTRLWDNYCKTHSENILIVMSRLLEKGIDIQNVHKDIRDKIQEYREHKRMEESEYDSALEEYER